MKKPKKNKRINKEQSEKVIRVITSDLIDQFNLDLDRADEALEQLEAMCLILNKANKFNSDPSEIIAAFLGTFPERKPGRIVSSFVKRDVADNITQKITLN